MHLGAVQTPRVPGLLRQKQRKCTRTCTKRKQAKRKQSTLCVAHRMNIAKERQAQRRGVAHTRSGTTQTSCVGPSSLSSNRPAQSATGAGQQATVDRLASTDKMTVLLTGVVDWFNCRCRLLNVQLHTTPSTSPAARQFYFQIRVALQSVLVLPRTRNGLWQDEPMHGKDMDMGLGFRNNYCSRQGGCQIFKLR